MLMLVLMLVLMLMLVLVLVRTMSSGASGAVWPTTNMDSEMLYGTVRYLQWSPRVYLCVGGGALMVERMEVVGSVRVHVQEAGRAGGARGGEVGAGQAGREEEGAQQAAALLQA